MKLKILIIAASLFIALPALAQTLTAEPISTPTLTAEPVETDDADSSLPEVDDKVIVDFESDDSSERAEGDPNKPIITGQVPNPEPAGIEHEDIGMVETDTGGSQVVPSQIKVILLAPSADAESDGASGADSLTIGGATYTVSGYLKIGDIKGESSDQAYGQDGSRAGKVEFEWKVEAGERAGSGNDGRDVIIGGTADRSTDRRLGDSCDRATDTCQPDDVDSRV